MIGQYAMFRVAVVHGGSLSSGGKATANDVNGWVGSLG
jgi:hypothetical protein